MKSTEYDDNIPVFYVNHTMSLNKRRSSQPAAQTRSSDRSTQSNTLLQRTFPSRQLPRSHMNLPTGHVPAADHHNGNNIDKPCQGLTA